MNQLEKQNENLKSIILHLLPKRIQDWIEKTKQANDYLEVTVPTFLKETKITGIDARVFEEWVRGLYLVIIFNSSSVDVYIDAECIKSIPIGKDK